MGWRDQLRSSPVRRLLGLAVLCGLILLGGRLLLDQPVKVVVVYELGRAAPTLRGLLVTYRKAPGPGGAAGDMVLRRRYNFPVGGAPETEAHHLRLKRGHYVLEAVLETAAGSHAVTRAVEVRGDGDIMRVPLE